MRAFIFVACLALLVTLIHSQQGVNVYRFNQYNWNIIDEPRNYDCLSQTGCVGTTPFNYTDETVDNVRTWYCGTNYANITILTGWNIFWPGFYIFQHTGWMNESCFELTLQGDSTFSIYQGGLLFFMTTDFKINACALGMTTTFEIRNPLIQPFNPKTFDASNCYATSILKLYSGVTTGRFLTFARRMVFRNLRGNITLENRPELGNHRWRGYPPEGVLEIGSWPGFEPVFELYGYMIKDGESKAKLTISSQTTSNAKVVFHPGSTVNLFAYPWRIDEMRPISGPNIMAGNFIINDTALQIEGNWNVRDTAVVWGPANTYNNFTWVSGTSGNTITLGGSFSYISFFANTTSGNYATTGTFNNCNAWLTTRATGWSWDRRGVDGVVTFNNVTIGSTATNVVNQNHFLTLRNGAFAFTTLFGNGWVNLVNATLTVAGATYVKPF